MKNKYELLLNKQINFLEEFMLTVQADQEAVKKLDELIEELKKIKVNETVVDMSFKGYPGQGTTLAK